VFWDASYDGRTFILDDYRTALSLVLLREGIADVNTADPGVIRRAQEGLEQLSDVVGVKWSLDDYTFLPEGRAWIHQAWSGDIVTAPYYGRGTPDEVAPTISYWFPPDHRGLVENDVVAIPRVAHDPVLAHAFIDFLLESTTAQRNFEWLGYQQPVAGVDEEHAIASFPWLGQPNLRSALVSPADLTEGYRLLSLPPAADELWQTAWLGFRSGA
jgi:spermidine/putrescine transport system substrate-binding protein